MSSRREGWGGGLAPVPSNAVDRPLLLERFDRATRKRVVLVVAPAGYGKSVLVAQWCVAHPERRVLAVAARPTDDAVHFGRRLLRALDEVRPGAADRASAHLALDGSALGEALQEALLEELAEVAPVTLVIEDLENLSSPILLDEIGQMAEGAEEGIGFVFVGRDDHLPKTPRLRLRDEVAEIRQDVLALSVDETAEAIAQVTGSTLHPLQVDALHAPHRGVARRRAPGRPRPPRPSRPGDLHHRVRGRRPPRRRLPERGGPRRAVPGGPPLPGPDLGARPADRRAV